MESVKKDKKQPRQLQQIPSDFNDVSDLWWDERTKVAQMSDIHLHNAIEKLERCEYEADETLRLRWVLLLKLEQNKREEERKAVFNKTIEENRKEADKDYVNYANNFPLQDPRD